MSQYENETNSGDLFTLVDDQPQNAVIKVFGCGGGGGNAVKHMLESRVEGVEFICANTDAQALRSVEAEIQIQLGQTITRGLGAGANPEIGRQSALEDREKIAEIMKGADMVFITAGMGGGTGTGAAPVVAEIAKDLGILTVAVVTKPFPFEGRRRMKIANEGLDELRQHVDSLITIPNEKLSSVLDKKVTLVDAFAEANNVLLNAVQGVADLIVRPGTINLDFADVRTVMSEMGMAMMGSGRASGEDRAQRAAEMAIRSPLLEDVDLYGAKGILVNVSAGVDLGLDEFSEVGNTIEDFASEDATVVVGTVIDPDLGDEIRVTVVATGIGEAQPVQTNKPKVAVDNTRKPDGSVDYKKLERPAIKRSADAAAATASSKNEEKPVKSAKDLDYLDIPAFLRRQAD
ncbi:cell division protein FtsZ [Reinekea marina]|uniref:Cell division protein FtsZ n=1 Tax=Reinekea marina TaxID=1310421 RepID=A0ABV7WT51_9GAMM|nr:cell division protein FtsZ [Reinekea marina]MBU2863581.1 cell division protein FtsZ [Reinekea forsetii]MDN3650521.1 cell division protein FtsZ [Reinekea marina]